MSRHEPDWRGIAADIERALSSGGRASTDRFVIEGTRLHERALRAGVPVDRVLVARSFHASSEDRIRSLLSALDGSSCTVRVAPDDVVNRLTEGRSLGAILGLVPRLPEAPIETLPVGAGTVFLVGVDVGDPGNVGALVRTALAAGASAFVAAGLGDPFHPRAVRTSMGSIFKLPVRRFDGVDAALEALDRRGIRKIGAVSSGGTPLPGARLGEGAAAVFLGSEAFGLPARLLEVLDEKVTIPMEAGVDSFSVNAAAAVLLYEFRRRAAAT